MPIFRYEAINPAGKLITGTHSASLVHDVEQWLEQNNMSPVSIEVTAESTSKGIGQSEAQHITWLQKLQGVSLDDLILFCRQTATLLGAGVDLLQSLRVIARQIKHPILKEIINQVGANIQQGAGLSESFKKYPKIFSPLFINIVLIGEESGNLDQSFTYLASLYENEKSIKEQIKTATRYPKIVITAICGAIFFLMSFVVPKFISLFENANVALPLATRILIGISNFFTANTLAIVCGVTGLILLYRFALNYRNVVMIRDQLLLRIPILGPLSVKIYMSRFCRVFSVLTKSGINIIHTLEMSAAALENMVLFSVLDKVRGEVEKGTNLYQAMNRYPVFPAMVIEMVSVGEEAGSLDEMMAKVADYYEVETNYTIRNLSTLIEPILLLFMGVMVGFIALAIFTPMWDMMNVARGG